MASRGIGTLTISLIAQTFGFEQGMDKAAKTADKRMKEIEASAKKAGAFIGAALGAGAVAVGTALTKLTVDAINYADALDEMSARTQISTEQLSKWGYAAKLSGTDLESLVSSTDKLAKNLAAAADGDSKMGQLFQALGISVKDAAGNLRDVEDVLPEIADRFKTLDNQTTETALAIQLFGKYGAVLLEFLNRGGDGIAALGDELQALGGVISGETTAASAQFKDELDRLKVTGSALGTQIAAELLPALVDTTKEFRQLVKDGNFASNIVGVLEGVMAAGVGTINLYNEAVFRTTVGLELLAKNSSNAITALKNITSLGIAEGTVSGSLADTLKNLDDAEAQIRANSQISVKPEVTLIDPGEGLEAWKQQKKAAEQAEALQERINKLLAEGSGKTSKAAEREAEKIAKAINKMQEAQRKWETELEGTGNPILDQYAQRLDQIKSSTEEFSRLKVPQERIAEFTKEMERLALAIKDKELTDFQREFNWETQQLSSNMNGASTAALSYERALFALNKELKQGLITEEQYNSRVAAEQEKRHEAATGLIRDLDFELKLLSLGNVERQTAIQLRGMDAESVKKYGDQIAQTNQAIYDSMQQVELMDGFRDSFQNFFVDVISGTESVSDAFKNMLDDINAMILNRIAQNWVDQLFGAMGTNQGGAAGGGWFGALMGIFSGGKAAGGVAHANRLYEVNESGMEMASVNGRDYLLTGSKPVQITPNGRMGGMQQTNVFTIQGKIDRRTEDQIVQQVGRRTQMAMARNG